MSSTTTRPRSRRKCANCRHRAVFRVVDAWDRSKNGKVVCASNVCWGLTVGGYPARGVAVD